jgi:quaternary ammonium compound-resistance protein SugE
MGYFILLLAGLAEIVGAVGLKYTAGFSKPLPSIITAASMVVSVWLLSVSIKTVPLGTAYAIWTGIGAIGSFIAGIILFGEAASTARIASVILIVGGLLALKLSS